MTDPTEHLPYVIENAVTGEEVGAAESFDAALLGAEVLRGEEGIDTHVRRRDEPRGWCGTQEVDERWLLDWFEFGFSELCIYLENDWRYKDWCRRTGRAS